MDYYINFGHKRKVTTPHGKVIVAVGAGALVLASLPIHAALRLAGRQGFYDDRTRQYATALAGFAPKRPPLTPYEHLIRGIGRVG